MHVNLRKITTLFEEVFTSSFVVATVALKVLPCSREIVGGFSKCLIDHSKKIRGSHQSFQEFLKAKTSIIKRSDLEITTPIKALSPFGNQEKSNYQKGLQFHL